MIVNLSLYFVLPCSCVTGMVFTSCESPLQGKGALQSGHFAWAGVYVSQWFFPQSGVFQEFFVSPPWTISVTTCTRFERE